MVRGEAQDLTSLVARAQALVASIEWEDIGPCSIPTISVDNWNELDETLGRIRARAERGSERDIMQPCPKCGWYSSDQTCPKCRRDSGRAITPAKSHEYGRSTSRCGECGGTLKDHRCEDCGTMHNGSSE